MRPFLAAAARADAVALVDPQAGVTLTHGELRAAVAEVARLVTGDKALVFLFCRNDLPTVLAYLACIEAGHAVTLLDGRLNEEARRKLIALYQPEWVVGAPGEGEGAWVERAGPPAARLWRRAGAHAGALAPELSLLLSTSGSTGSPKLVRLSRQAVEANAAAIASALAVDPEERAVASLPLHYSYGLSVLNSHLHAGASVVLTDESVLSPPYWELVRQQRCTSMAGVPYSYQMLERIGFARMEAPSLRTLTQAGGGLAPAIVERFHKIMTTRGGRFFVMYGQTEATARIATLPAEALPAKLGSVGRAIPGGLLTIDRDGERTGAAGVTGEIVYTGPNVMMGYAETRADLGRGDELGGALYTGDLGHLDEDGYLFVTGRTKRIAKVFGVRVNLDEVEAMVRGHGPTAAVAGTDKIVLHCEFGEPALHAQLAQQLAAALHIHYRSFDFRRVPALPLTERGKIDYARLKEGT